MHLDHAETLDTPSGPGRSRAPPGANVSKSRPDPVSRLQRVNQLMREEISHLIQRELKDPAARLRDRHRGGRLQGPPDREGLRERARVRARVAGLAPGPRERPRVHPELARSRGSACGRSRTSPSIRTARWPTRPTSRRCSRGSELEERPPEEPRTGEAGVSLVSRTCRRKSSGRWWTPSSGAGGCSCSPTSIPTGTCSGRSSGSASPSGRPAGRSPSPARTRCRTRSTSCPGRPSPAVEGGPERVRPGGRPRLPGPRAARRAPRRRPRTRGPGSSTSTTTGTTAGTATSTGWTPGPPPPARWSTT